MSMKLAAVITAALLALPGIAVADPYYGPMAPLGGGPPPMAAPPMAAPPMAQPPMGPMAQGPQGPRGPRGPGREVARERRAEMHAMLLQMFDANHDGRLEPNERRQAARMLRRMARQMSRGDGEGGGAAARANRNLR